MTCCVPFFFFSTSEYFHRSLLRFPLLLLPLLYEPPRTATALWRDSDRFRTGKETGKGEALPPAVVLNRDCLFFFFCIATFFSYLGARFVNSCMHRLRDSTPKPLKRRLLGHIFCACSRTPPDLGRSMDVQEHAFGEKQCHALLQYKAGVS